MTQYFSTSVEFVQNCQTRTLYAGFYNSTLLHIIVTKYFHSKSDDEGKVKRIKVYKNFEYMFILTDFVFSHRVVSVR